MRSDSGPGTAVFKYGTTRAPSAPPGNPGGMGGDGGIDGVMGFEGVMETEGEELVGIALGLLIASGAPRGPADWSLPLQV